MGLKIILVVGIITLLIGFTLLSINQVEEEQTPQEDTPKFMENGEWKKIVFGNEKQIEEVVLNG